MDVNKALKTVKTLENKGKKCVKCRKIKPAEDFTKSKRNPDRLSCECKRCQKIRRDFYAKKQLESVTKCCPKCGISKPATDFHKNRRSPDGLQHQCKECDKTYKIVYRKLCREGGLDKKTRIGISTWGQVNSVLREMAELQIAINKENAALEKRIAMIREYSQDAIEPSLCHQICLQFMLEEFLKKRCAKHKITFKQCRFGFVRFHRGKMDFKLNIVLAEKRIGLP
jgi:hypothetical protein